MYRGNDNIRIAVVKWGTSRGLDTYGYTVCTLYVDGAKKGQAKGGGYDLRDAAFSEFLMRDYQKRINDYCRGKKKKPYSATIPGSLALADNNKDGTFYLFKRGGNWHLDGGNGCALDCARRLGLDIRENLEPDRRRGGLRGSGVFIITDKRAAKK